MPEENNEEENDEVEVIEFSLSLDEINELMEKLDFLRRTKTEISFSVDEYNELLIHYFDENAEDEDLDLDEKEEDSEEDEEFEGEY
ncbi:MAG: hypothetical protein WC812_01420 [Candidatus Pacearchaeota archaeon]|jgi:hypothetical protein